MIKNILILTFLLTWQYYLGGQTIERFISENKVFDLTPKTVVKDIVTTTQGLTYILTKRNQIYRTKYTDKYIERLTKFSTSYKYERLLVDHSENVWVLSAEGYLINLSEPIRKGAIVRVIPSSELTTTIIDIVLDKNYLNILTKEFGLFRYQLSDEHIIKNAKHMVFPNVLKVSNSKSIWRNKQKEPEPPNKFKLPTAINAIHLDYANTLWFGSEEGLYNLKNKSTTPLFEGPINAITSKSSFVYAAGNGIVSKFYATREGKIYSKEELLSGVNNIKDLAVDENDHLWIIGESIVKFDLSDKTWITYNKKSNPSYKSRKAACIAIDSKNHKVWIGTKGSGTYIIDNSLVRNKENTPVKIDIQSLTLSDTEITNKANSKGSNLQIVESKGGSVNNVVRKKVEFGKINRFQTLTFNQNSAGLTAEGMQIMDHLAEQLLQLETKHDFEIIINGHSSKNQFTYDPNLYYDSINYQLSINRAVTVSNYLKMKKIVSKRIHWNGYGDKIPISTLEKNKSKNQRVDIILKREGEPVTIFSPLYKATVSEDKVQFKSNSSDQPQDLEYFNFNESLSLQLDSENKTDLTYNEEKQLEVITNKLHIIQQVTQSPSINIRLVVNDHMSLNDIENKWKVILNHLTKQRVQLRLFYSFLRTPK